MKLIMRADDLGFSEAVNLGIYKAVKEGVITSVGMMTNMEHVPWLDGRCVQGPGTYSPRRG